MQKMILVVLAVLLVFSTVGCTPEIIRAGGDRDARLYNAQNAAKSIEVAKVIALANIPACKLVAREGMDIVISGAESFECYGNTITGGESDNPITQRVSPAWEFLHSQGNNIFGAVTMCLVFGACGLGGTGAVPSVGPSPQFIEVRPEIVRPEVIFATP